MTKVIQVAVAIITKPNGEYLLASRPDGKGWAGWWEFPGGKIEKNETPEDALTRELQEELGIMPALVQPWVKRRYDYPATHDAKAKTVLLHFYFVLEWQGEPKPLEGQVLAWQHPQQLNVSPVLPANAPVMHALSLPGVYAISHAAEMGEAAFLAALQRQLQQGLKLIQIREKQMDRVTLIAFIGKVRLLAKQYKARVLVNSDVVLAMELGLDGVHLPSKDLLQLKETPNDLLVAASCHNATELAHAQMLGLDFVTLSPVAATLSHSGTTSLGWQVFATLVENATIPVYALGGMRANDLPQALSSGARGIAMQRAVWGITAI
ncbi:MAG: Nudix family hydrolase [Methylophilaceae bacterium]